MLTVSQLAVILGSANFLALNYVMIWLFFFGLLRNTWNKFCFLYSCFLFSCYLFRLKRILTYFNSTFFLAGQTGICMQTICSFHGGISDTSCNACSLRVSFRLMLVCATSRFVSSCLEYGFRRFYLRLTSLNRGFNHWRKLT